MSDEPCEGGEEESFVCVLRGRFQLNGFAMGKSWAGISELARERGGSLPCVVLFPTTRLVRLLCLVHRLLAVETSVRCQPR